MSSNINQIQCIDADASGDCDIETQYDYDAYGNLADDGANTYTYDAAMRLVSVTDGVTTTTHTSYDYDGDGNRVAQHITEDSLTTTTTYVLDVATSMTMVLAETTGSDTIFYLHGLDLIAQSDGTSTEYLLADGLGSVRQVVDSTGNPLMAQTYDPYGNRYAYGGPEERFTVAGFTGESEDKNGLMFLRARYYAPTQGRFLNMDPSRRERNPYQYVGSDPVNFRDPSGLVEEGAEAEYADQLISFLVDLYNVQVRKDYGYVTVWEFPRNPDLPATSSCVWLAGRWTTEELSTLFAGVRDLATAMGGPAKFRAEMGQTLVVRQYPISGLGETKIPDVKLDDDPSNTLSNWTVVHEFAHAWDQAHEHALSNGLMTYTGGDYLSESTKQQYWADVCGATMNSDGSINFHGNDWMRGCNKSGYMYASPPPKGSDRNFNAREDWAESVTAYVYPAYATNLVQVYQSDPNRSRFLWYADYRETDRWAYVNGVINGKLP